MTAAMISLANITLGSAQSTVTFSSIPSTYRDLRVVLTPLGGDTNARFRINSDTGSNYSEVYMSGDGSSAGSGSSTMTYAGAGRTTSTPSANTIDIMDYSATDKHKTILARLNPSQLFVSASASRWANTAAVISLTFINQDSSNFSAGSTFALYGIVS